MCPNFWTHFGHIVDTSFLMVKIEQMCPKFGHIMDMFWTHFLFGHVLDALWTHYGHIFGLDIFWTHYGHILDTFQE